MLKQSVVAVFLTFCGFQSAFSDTIQLKDKGAIVGNVVAEKKDQVAVDVGYTILLVPRNEIVKISKTDASVPPPKPASGQKSSTSDSKHIDSKAVAESGFYSAPSRALPSRTVRELVNQLGEAVVQVRTPSGLGSGFIINEDGYLMTNFHVVEGETQISVEVYHRAQDGTLERKTYKQVRIIAMNKFADLTLLKIEDKDLPKFKYVVMGNADAMAVGERVFAIGSPLGLERTVTEGILSTKTRQLGGELYLQTTTQINPGNSGGPLFDMSGEVVGITNMKITFGEGLGFAIPVEAVKFFLDHRDAFAYSNDNPSNPYRYLEPPSRTHHTTADDNIQ
jgi:serine protease Do